jgi:hypothetical protein
VIGTGTLFYLHSQQGGQTANAEPMILMQTAYWVHGALAPILPFEIPRQCKVQIRQCIEQVERATDAALSYPGNMLLAFDEDPSMASHASSLDRSCCAKPKSD